MLTALRNDGFRRRAQIDQALQLLWLSPSLQKTRRIRLKDEQMICNIGVNKICWK